MWHSLNCKAEFLFTLRLQFSCFILFLQVLATNMNEFFTVIRDKDCVSVCILINLVKVGNVIDRDSTFLVEI